jgi:hypothetical protein
MFKTTLNALIGSAAIVSAIVIFSADADAGKRRVSGFSASPVKMKTMKTVKAGSRRTTIKQGFTGTSGVPAQGGHLLQLACRLDGGCLQPGGGRRLDGARRSIALHRPGWK